MNYLAHFYLSFGDADLLLGNLAGDVVKGDDWKHQPIGIQRGILLHREIDFFTDTHPSTFVLKRSLVPFAGRFSGPVSDILRDYLLAKSWDVFHPENLDIFSQWVYRILEDRWQELPSVLHPKIQKMMQHRWLASYQDLAGMQFVFEKFAPRLPQGTLKIDELLEWMVSEEPMLLADFQRFFPELATACSQALHEKIPSMLP